MKAIYLEPTDILVHINNRIEQKLKIVEKSISGFDISYTNFIKSINNRVPYMDEFYKWYISEMETLIDSFSILENNWNGYNAEPISVKSIDISKVLIETFIKKFDNLYAYPTSRTSIQFESDIIEIEVDENDIEIYYTESDIMKKIKAVQDGDGHWFLIPNELYDEFEADLNSESEFEEFDNKYHEYRLSGCLNNVQLWIE